MKKTVLFALLLSPMFLLAQAANDSGSAAKDTAKPGKGQVIVQGCVSRASGDYILMKQDPAMTYELQPTGKIKLRHYLGQRVEITGSEAASLSTSSDALTRTGSASSVTLIIDSIKTIAKECTARSAQ
jgi:hypothetical protein